MNGCRRAYRHFSRPRGTVTGLGRCIGGTGGIAGGMEVRGIRKGGELGGPGQVGRSGRGSGLGKGGRSASSVECVCMGLKGFGGGLAGAFGNWSTSL